MLLQLLRNDPSLAPSGELRRALGQRVQGRDVGGQRTGLASLLGVVCQLGELCQCRSGGFFFSLPTH